MGFWLNSTFSSRLLLGCGLSLCLSVDHHLVKCCCGCHPFGSPGVPESLPVLQWPGAHVLVLGAGTGVLGMLCAAEGAGRVTSVERGRMLYRLAKMIVLDNPGAAGIENLHMIDRRLQAVGVAGGSLQ
jgi:hypothetical protein